MNPINHKKTVTGIAILALLGGGAGAMAGGITEQLLQEYQQAGAQSFSASAGQSAWDKTHVDPDSGKEIGRAHV